MYSVDFNPATGHLVTSGSDREVKARPLSLLPLSSAPSHTSPQLWEVYSDADGAPAVRHLDSLGGHNKTVNCVRFSPGGDLLVSAVRHALRAHAPRTHRSGRREKGRPGAAQHSARPLPARLLTPALRTG